jgi:hypothetical protein
MFLIGYPAVGLCLLILTKSHATNRMSRVWVLSGLILALMGYQVIAARRGPLLPIVVMLVYVPYLLRRRNPNRFIVGTSLAASGLVMLTFVYMRPYSYAPDGVTAWTLSDRIEGWRKGLSEFALDTVFLQKQKKNADNEFLYHCGMIATMWQLGDYQYGTGYVTLLVNWVPRQWWPDKPGLEEGFFSSRWQEEMPGTMGWKMSSGAAGGGVADTFGQFGLLTPLFWGLLGALAARLYERSVHSGDDVSTVQYVGFICTTHWLIGQGFGAMFVPACYCIVIPTVVLRQYRVRIGAGGLAPQPSRRMALSVAESKVECRS